MLPEIRHYWKSARDIRRFLQMPALTDPRAAVLAKRKDRDSLFLTSARQFIFERPGTTYHQLFALAGCQYGDLVDSVGRDGLEKTLSRLQEAGVYLTHDEFKGHTGVTRGGKTFEGGPEAFANPLLRGGIESSTSGSRSRGTVMRKSMEWYLYREGLDRFLFPALGLDRHTRILVMPMLPSLAGMQRAIWASRMNPVGRWFALGGTAGNSAHYRALTAFLVMAAKLSGAKVPLPHYLPENDFTVVARYVAKLRSEGRKCVVDAVVSPGVRVAAAAREKGLDISGSTFIVTGEALTNAKRAVIESTGCQALSIYIVSEAGFIGMGCPDMNRDNCVHLMDDYFALISRRRTAPLCDMELDSLLFTTVTPFSVFVLVNAEMDDSGQIEPATCDCVLSRFGYRRQIRNIFSYGKLTGQGTTLLAGDLLRIIEELLPARFGGTPADYQLVEGEGNSQTTIELRVHPRLGIVSQKEVESYFLGEIGKLWGGSLTRREWMQTGGVRVVAAEPYMNRTGKVLPLHLLGFGGRT